MSIKKQRYSSAKKKAKTTDRDDDDDDEYFTNFQEDVMDLDLPKINNKNKRKRSEAFDEEEEEEGKELFGGGNAASLEEAEASAIVHNRSSANKNLQKRLADHTELDVLPKDAHNIFERSKKKERGKKGATAVEKDDVGGGDDGGFQRMEVDEGELAILTNKKMKKGLHLSDYDIFENEDEDGEKKGKKPSMISQKKSKMEKATGEKGLKKKSANDNATMTSSMMGGGNNAEIIEKIERDFQLLSSDDKLKMLEEQSPELIKLVEALHQNLCELKDLGPKMKKIKKLFFAKPSNRGQSFEKLKKKAASASPMSDSDAKLLSFLETKMQLMISYAMHILFYILLKVEGRKVDGHPVIDKLVELRVYLEKLSTMEHKLQYSLNKLLNRSEGKESQQLGVNPNLKGLRPVGEGGSGEVYQPTKHGANIINPNASKRKAQEEAEKLKAIEREEETGMVRLQLPSAKNKSKVSSKSDLVTAAVDLGFQEDNDQFFENIVQKRNVSKKRKELEEEEDKEDLEEDMLSSEEIASDMFGEEEEQDEEDGPSYQQLLKQEKVRTKETLEKGEAEKKARGDIKTKDELEVQEGKHRGISKNIQNRRGLTKTRRKDRKNPRTNQRKKYARGLRVAQAQGNEKKIKGEPSSGFAGVAGLKTNVTHGRSLG